MNFVRLVVLGFIVLTVIFVCVSLYSRSVRRERLENEWDRDPTRVNDMAGRAAHVEKGMAAYFNGFRRRLVVLVYIIPTVVIAAIIYIMNY